MHDLLNGIWQALKSTPIWVYLLFFYCIFIGVISRKDGVVSIYKMLIMPIVFTYMSVETLYLKFGIHYLSVGTFVVALMLGLFMGLLQAKLQGVSVDKEKKLVAIPGSNLPLILILIIFSSKYYFGYELDANPNIANNTTFEIALLVVSGMTAGLFAGRVTYYFSRMKKGPWVELSE